MVYLVLEKENIDAQNLDIIFGDSLRLTRIKDRNSISETENDNNFYYMTDVQIVKRNNIVNIEPANESEIELFNFMKETPDKDIPVTKKRFENFNLPIEFFQEILR